MVRLIKVKVKVRFTPEQATKAYSFLNLGASWGWVVNATLRPLYPRERLCAHSIGIWLGPRAGVEDVENVAPTGIRSPDRPARSQSLYRLSYRGPHGTPDNF